MKISDYQEAAVSTAVYGAGNAVFYPSLGLCGEAGEVANKVKKVMRDNNGLLSEEKRIELGKELGDCLWYLAALARDLGLSLETIAEENIAKLKSRQERGTLQGSGDNR